MDRLHVKGVAQQKRNIVLGTDIGQPIPAKHALYGNGHIFKVWENELKKSFRIGFDVFVHFGFTGLIEDTHIHFSCVQIDAAIKFVLFLVKTHNLASFS